jgi:riboflavin biosynthesis pyrimidine reductase
VWKKQYSLTAYSAPDNFKSYDELKIRLDTVLAGTTTVGNIADEPVETVTIDTKEEPVPSVSVTDDGDEDTISYFEKLAEKD